MAQPALLAIGLSRRLAISFEIATAVDLADRAYRLRQQPDRQQCDSKSHKGNDEEARDESHDVRREIVQG
jgi:hypothetical protein